jgi:uncharacterized membrane protein YagU involved in acid resistance
MKVAAGITIFSIVFAIVYGVVFAIVYPLTTISNALVSLFAILGLATSLILAAVWAAVAKKNT